MGDVPKEGSWRLGETGNLNNQTRIEDTGPSLRKKANSKGKSDLSKVTQSLVTEQPGAHVLTPPGFLQACRGQEPECVGVHLLSLAIYIWPQMAFKVLWRCAGLSNCGHSPGYLARSSRGANLREEEAGLSGRMAGTHSPVGTMSCGCWSVNSECENLSWIEVLHRNPGSLSNGLRTNQKHL